MNNSARLLVLGFNQPESLEKVYKSLSNSKPSSLLGPTNLPPLDALTIGKKMEVSLIHKESLQTVEPGVIYFYPYSVNEMRDAMLHAIELERDFKVVKFEESNRMAVLDFLNKLVRQISLSQFSTK